MAYKSKALVTECFADTAALEIVFQLANKSLNKQHGVSNVAKVMKEKGVGVIRMGIIDGDRGRHVQNPYFEYFIKEDSYDDLLHLKKHNQFDQYLVVIEPAIEYFLIEAATEAGLSTYEYPFLKGLDKMKELCKDSEIYNNSKFREFIKHLKREAPDCIVTLSKWISEKMDWQNPIHDVIGNEINK